MGYIIFTNNRNLKWRKGESMKKIWSLLILLLLIMILCIWTKKDSIHLTSDTPSHVASKTAVMESKHAINYQLIQKDKDNYILSGNFKNVQQQNALSDIFSASGAILGYKGTTTNKTLTGGEIITLTQTILPHFITHYTNGKITYENEILNVSGDVQGYEAKHIMQRLLNSTIIPTQNDTNVHLVEPIDFSIIKDNNMLKISGTFTNKEQIHLLSKYLRPSYSAVNINKNVHRIDKGGIMLTEKILPSFIKYYSSGKVNYKDETLLIEGMVETQEALDEMNTLLSGADIPVKNLTVINPDTLKKAQEVQIAALEKTKDDEAAKNAQLNTQTKAQEAEDETAKALLLEREKARLDAAKLSAQMKLAADAAKAKIKKLLQIENIEFQVAKGSLTQKGQTTVDKLANILTQYPHIKAEIAGHTDSDGSAIFNQKLSQERVDTVKRRLMSKGIGAARLTAKGYGESQPLVPNTSDENKQTNRRVEINIQGE